MKFRRVVITGLGAVTPIGNDVPTYWDNLLNGVGGSAPITLFDSSAFKTHFACEVKGFNPEEEFDRKELKKYDRYVQFALKATREAIADSALDVESIDPDRVGVVFATGVGGITSMENEMEAVLSDGKGLQRFSPFYITRMIADMASGHISMKYNFRGPNFGVVSACASSTHAMAVALDQIRLGRADIMITGGAEAAINRSGIGGFNSMHALSTKNDEYATASRPFSKSRDGFVMGEGAGSLVFEELEHALARGAKIYAEVKGVAATADAYHLTATHPDGLGAFSVMKNALKEAEISVDEVDYINAHGTSTPNGDVSELKAIQALFGDHAKNINISSTKSMTGHLLGATGAIEAIAAILAIRDGVVPPTINHGEDDCDPEIDYSLNLTFNKCQKRSVRVAISNTFGFGGHNATIIFKRYE
ncbi:MAG: beta-ketoacyl-ACP synthase II [Paludibacteraceae bacterium]|jgi:3-oxoacyl-[acyl-carrier-protein] synthase II|nr:beta-ketoacyl-ACP synthase II [Paludibacteraceae bacterium]